MSEELFEENGPVGAGITSEPSRLIGAPWFPSLEASDSVEAPLEVGGVRKSPWALVSGKFQRFLFSVVDVEGDGVLARLEIGDIRLVDMFWHPSEPRSQDASLGPTLAANLLPVNG